MGSNYDICGVNGGIRDHSLWPDPLNICVAVVMPNSLDIFSLLDLATLEVDERHRLSLGDPGCK